MYSQLLEETFESAAQRKERLFSKAKALRAAREQKRREFVAKITEERWRCVLIVRIVRPAAACASTSQPRVCFSEGSDDLRTLDSQAIAQRCAEERIAQLEEAEAARLKAVRMRIPPTARCNAATGLTPLLGCAMGDRSRTKRRPRRTGRCCASARSSASTPRSGRGASGTRR